MPSHDPIDPAQPLNAAGASAAAEQPFGSSDPPIPQDHATESAPDPGSADAPHDAPEPSQPAENAPPSDDPAAGGTQDEAPATEPRSASHTKAPGNGPAPVFGDAKAAAAAQAAALRASEAYMVSKLAESGLVPADCTDVHPFVYTTESVKVDKVFIDLAPLCEGAFRIGYYGVDGAPLIDPLTGAPSMYRIRHRLRAGAAVTEASIGKYRGPSKERVGPLLATAPYLLPPLPSCTDRSTWDIHEGELKALCGRKFAGQHAGAIGGCNNWSEPDSKSGRVQPMILQYIERHGITAVRLWPDGDLVKYAVQAGWAAFARALLRDAPGVTVNIVSLEAFGRSAKFDDLIVAQGWDAVRNGLRIIAPDDLRESHEDMVRRLPGLSHRTTDKGGIIVMGVEKNLSMLLDLHPRYAGELWWNDDRLSPMRGDAPWKPGLTLTDLLTDMQHHFHLDGTRPGTGINLNKVETCAVQIAKHHPRSPFRERVEAETWDMVPRLDTWLIDYCGATDTVIVRAASSRLLIGAVGRLRRPGEFMRWMLVLVGPQDIGKSGIFLTLFGYDEVVYLVKASQGQGKDSLLLLHSGRCIADEEMATHTQGEHAENKARISAVSDTFRAPYDRAAAMHMRSSVLVGSSNDHEFLQADPSGNNRYVPVDVRGVAAGGVNGRFDFAGLEAVVAQLWAEAAVREGKGEPFDTVPGADANARKYERNNPYIEPLLDYLFGGKAPWLPGSASMPGEVCLRMHDIANRVEIGALGRGTPRQVERGLGDALRDLGFVQRRSLSLGGNPWYADGKRFGVEVQVDKVSMTEVCVQTAAIGLRDAVFVARSISDNVPKQG